MSWADASEVPGNSLRWAPAGPQGRGPRLFLKQVREPKTQKIRLHLDVRVAEGPPDERWARVIEEVARLGAIGGTVLREFPGHHVVMADPEGNEFCVC
nr:VOC family protein [Nonomuraea lactucae]